MRYRSNSNRRRGAIIPLLGCSVSVPSTDLGIHPPSYYPLEGRMNRYVVRLYRGPKLIDEWTITADTPYEAEGERSARAW